MSSKIADLLVVAHMAAVEASAEKNIDKLEKAVELAMRALTHPQAPSFFAALDAAAVEIDDLQGNDPDLLDNDGGPLNPLAPDPDFGDEEDENPDEDSDAASPVDEGLVNHEEQTAAFAVVRKPKFGAEFRGLASKLASR